MNQSPVTIQKLKATTGFLNQVVQVSVFYVFFMFCMLATQAQCVPNDPTAQNGTLFCAPEPVCSAGNFLWSQTIDNTTGMPSVVRLVANSTEFYEIPSATFPVAFSGPVTITVSDVVSYDGYEGRDVVVPQPNERWKIRFERLGVTVGETPFTNDLADLQNQAYWRGPLGTPLFFQNGFDEIVILHENFPNQQGNTAGSVTPVSICFNYVASSLGSIGDQVWIDANNNGIFDNGEPPVRNEEVCLYKDDNNDNIPDGAAIATTTTDFSGTYVFLDLVPGNYIVGVTTPAGTVSSAVNGGDPDNNINNDNNGVTVFGTKTIGNAITLTAGGEPGGNSNNTYDFGFVPTQILGNQVWEDTNNNGIFDGGEAGIPGVEVCLFRDDNNDNIPDGAAIATFITNAGGSYVFVDLFPGNYIVGATTPAGFVRSAVNGGDPDNDIDNDNNGLSDFGGKTIGNAITLTSGGEPGGNLNITYDFGFVPVPPALLTLGNYVWLDANNNGIADPGESGIPDTEVCLFKDDNNDNIPDGAVIATVNTNASGLYEFSNLLPGNYIVAVTTPTGTVSSSVNGGDPDNNIDNDDNGLAAAGGKTYGNAITLTAGGEPTGGNTNNTYDFGFVPTQTLGNYVWLDANNNGIADPGESGIPNAEVCLFKDDNNDNIPDGAVIATVNTTASGLYEFSNLLPGNYIVAVTTPTGTVSSSVNGGDPDNNIDNDDNGLAATGGKTYGNAITLTVGGEPDGNSNTTYDFGFVTVPVITLSITCPPAVTVTACTTATGVNLGTPVINGNCTAVRVITNNAPTAFPRGQTTVTWTVNDGCGNTATCTQLVTVTGFSVNLGPDQSLCNGEVTLTATTSGGVTTGPAPGTPFTEVSGSTADMRLFSGNINHITIGNTFSQHEARDNCGKNATASVTLNIPAGAVVKKAYLFWSGSGSLDNQVKLNGVSVTADGTKTFSRSGGFYYFAARKDVTSLVTGSGVYGITDLVWSNGSPYCNDNSAYGAWAMTVIYEKVSLPSARIHVNTEKFTFTYPAATYSTTINNIHVPAGCAADAKLTIVAFEGDNYKTEKLRIAGVLDPNYNNFRGQTGPNLDIVTKDAPGIVGGTTSLTYSIQSYLQSTIYGNAIEGLFDYVKVLKYNNCPPACNSLTYLWNTGATTRTLTHVGPGTYSVIVTDCSGCVAKDTVIVTACPPVDPAKCYKIIARCSGKALTIKSASTSNGADAEQRTYAGTGNQIWNFEEVQPGFYKITNANSGKALEVTSGSTSDGTVIQQNAYTGANFQLWSLTQNGSYFIVKARHSNKAMRVKSGSTSEAAVVEQGGTGLYSSEQWSFYEVDCPAAPRANSFVSETKEVEEEVEEVQTPVEVEVKAPATFEVNIQSPVIVKDEFKVNVYPNPAGYEFTIMVSSRSNEKITVRILDMNGAVRSVQTPITKSNSIKVGKDLNGGTYMAEVTQGKNRKVVKIVKLD